MSRHFTARRTGLLLLVSGSPATVGCLAKSDPVGASDTSNDAGVSVTTGAAASGSGGAVATSGSGSSSGNGGASSSSGSTGDAGSSGSTGSGAGGSGGAAGKLFVGYYQTWSDGWKASGADTVLANLPGYVNVVNLSFAQPDMTYSAGSVSLSGTGISVPYDGPTLKVAVATLHERNPGTRVMLSVGGATFPSFGSFNAGAIAAFVKDFGLDGVDIDYEPSTRAELSPEVT